MQINEAGLSLIKEFEGLRLKAYKDSGGIWTIGYGHTGSEVYSELQINENKADELLRHDITHTENGVTKLVKTVIGSNQFSALVCFAYNVGVGNLAQSTLLHCINKGNLMDAVEQFVKWNKVQGKVIDGLTRRRLAEKNLFLIGL